MWSRLVEQQHVGEFWDGGSQRAVCGRAPRERGKWEWKFELIEVFEQEEGAKGEPGPEHDDTVPWHDGVGSRLLPKVGVHRVAFWGLG
jgi:hypothetical protein